MGNYFTIPSLIIIAVLMGALVYLYLLLSNKQNQILQLNYSLNKMKTSFEKLDEQAKLIVKTDLELNKAQEELDRRIHSLDALQKTSRLISTTLDENEIFHRLDQSLITNLNFEKNLIFVYDLDKNLHVRINHGFSENDIHIILLALKNDSLVTEGLKNGTTFSSVTSSPKDVQTITSMFHVDHFVLTPILTQNGIAGFVFVGNQSNAAGTTEGDEELLSILANQIGQSLENARLFEQIFRSRQNLELKIQERTKQLESALEEVKIVSKTKSEFISAVSHELRTPLTSIKGYAAILMAGKLGDVPEPVKLRLGKINEHSDNLVGLINNLLDIARIESGRVEMSMKQSDLAHIVENVHDLLTPQMKEKNIHWRFIKPPDLPEILSDPTQIERVFINLIGNAIKFTPPEGTITVKMKNDLEKLSVEVSDTGIGIPEENIGKLFDEFFRVENKINQNVKGTGLGLSLAKKIIEAHNGTIWVTSKVNVGTTFHFTIPFCYE